MNLRMTLKANWNLIKDSTNKKKNKDQSWNIEELMSLTPIPFTIIHF